MSAIHVVVPAYNPGEIIIDVIERARCHADSVVIVDDGCDPANRACLERCAHPPGVTLLTHERNRGKGVALMTGIGRCLEWMQAGDHVLTMDSDGQRRTATDSTIPRTSHVSGLSSANARRCTSPWGNGSTRRRCP